MLSAQTINTVKSTAPLLADEGENITRLFYQKLFDNHPELKHIFNLANQAKGEQARALAESVFAYASHIDELEKLGPLVSRIAHKHASLQVEAEHYPVVGKFLLEAIRDHLKLADNDPVLKAWAEAYGALADIFINTEEQIYQANQTKEGGWRGFRAFAIDRIVTETEEIKSFYMRPADNGPIADFSPGQFVGVKTHPNSSEYEEIRQYSLSNAPGEDYYRIIVKAEGRDSSMPGQVSNFLHAATTGDEVLLQPPTGDFVLTDHSEPLVLIAGGIGITPLLSMLHARVKAKANGTETIFIQCCRDRAHQPMHDELQALANTSDFAFHLAYETGTEADHIGYLDSDVLRRWLGDSSAHQVYFCGPTPFMAALHILLSRHGYEEEQLHYEIFGPSIRLNQQV